MKKTPLTVRKAVLPVAGLGTRMLPATKAIPKEMLPVVDKPLIQYVVREAIAAGIKEIVLVTHSSKTSSKTTSTRVSNWKRPSKSESSVSCWKRCNKSARKTSLSCTSARVRPKVWVTRCSAHAR